MLTPCTGKCTQTRLSRLHHRFPHRLLNYSGGTTLLPSFPLLDVLSVCDRHSCSHTHVRARTQACVLMLMWITENAVTAQQCWTHLPWSLSTPFVIPKEWDEYTSCTEHKTHEEYHSVIACIISPECPAAHLYISSLTPVWPRSWWENA